MEPGRTARSQWLELDLGARPWLALPAPLALASGAC